LSTRQLVTWITFLAIFAMSARVSVDSDTWWHLRTGQWIIDNKTVPTTDPFSYTSLGQPWLYPSSGWLVEVPITWIYKVFGPGGLNLWTGVMVTLAFAFIWRAMSGGVFLRSFTLVLAAATSGVYWAARPYLVTFLLAAVFLWLLERDCWQPTDRALYRLWALPILMVVWANSHGGFVIGFILWGVYWFAEGLSWLLPALTRQRALWDGRQRHFLRLCLVGALMILAVTINPSGLVMLAYPFKTVSIGALQDYILEWQSPDFHLRQAQPFIWLLLVTFAAVGVSRRRLALTDFLLVSGFTYMALLAWRNVALFALVAPIVLTRHAAPVVAALGRSTGFREAKTVPPTRTQKILNGAILVILILAVLLKAGVDFPLAANQAEFRKTMPLDAVASIKQQAPPGRLFNSYNWGGYLQWELPEYPVFIDGRTDLYNDELISQWLQVVRSEPGWQQVLDQWDVRLVLIEPGMPIVGQLQDAGWQLLYKDKTAIVFSR
jgi:uncharacterized membrane protein